MGGLINMPDNSFIRFENDDVNTKLTLLHSVYQFESKRVSGSHGGGRRHTTLRWTLNEIVPYLQSVFQSEEEQVLATNLNNLIESLVEGKHMMRYRSGEQVFHVTRVGETVRNLTCLHEFQQRDVRGEDALIGHRYPIMDGLRWEPRLRMGPARNISADILFERLENQFASDHRLPCGTSITDALQDFRLVLKAYQRKFGNSLLFSEFQVRAIVEELVRSWKGYDKALVLTAGTGMGKTIAFAIPVLTDALIRNRGGRVCSQILLYPRNDLAKDQYSELNKVMAHINDILCERNLQRRVIGIALDADSKISRQIEYYPHKVAEAVRWGVGYGNVYDSSRQVYSGEQPAAVVACSIESFRRRLRYKSVVLSLQAGLHRIVSDEVHLTSGVQGGHVTSILKRCQKFRSLGDTNPIGFIGVSATIAKPRKHVSKLWFGNEEGERNVLHVDAGDVREEEPMGILHHIMLKDRQHASSIGSLVDITSAVVHHRRHPSMNRAARYEALQKTIGFADSHEIVGDWFSYMLDNEVTSSAARMESEGNTTMRTPYNQWHDAPISIHEGGDAVCNSCRNSEYSEPIQIQSNKLELIKTTREYLEDSDDRFQLRFLESETFDIDEDGNYRIKGLDTCPHLESGTCWWFAPRTGELERRPGDPDGFSFRESVRVKRHTSKNNSGDDDDNEDTSADHTFRQRAVKGAYPKNHLENATINWQQQIPHDVAIATPTLEVGVDMNNVTEVITHKAIRNVSSYRQKVGRSGRERGTDALAVTLLSASGQDFHHYRSMRRLVDAEISDPVPIASGNKFVLSSQAYETVFDFIVANPDLKDIEFVGRKRLDTQESLNLDENIQDCMDALLVDGNSIQDCYDYVRSVIPPQLLAGDIHRSIRMAHLHLQKMLLPIRQGEDGHPISVIRYIASANNGYQPPEIDVNKPIWDNLLLAQGFFNNVLDDNERNDLNRILENKHVDDMRDFAGKLNNPMVDAAVGDLQDAASQDPFNREIEELCNQERHELTTTYLSTILRALPSIRSSAPFISPDTLFLNPHEDEVEVRHSYGEGGRSEFIPNSEALIFTLPGMWTHRVFKGQRFYISSGMRAIPNQDRPLTFRMQMDSEVVRNKPPEYSNAGTLTQEQLNLTPNILEANLTENMPLKRLTKIYVQRDDGLTGRPNTVKFRNDDTFQKLLVTNMDVPEGGGFPAEKKRPKGYPITWVYSRFNDDTTPCQSYDIPYTVGNGEGCKTVHVTKHPLMHALFSHIDFAHSLKVTRTSFGVSRNNDVILQPYDNGRDIAFVDEFNTQGFSFELNDEFIQRGRSKLLDLDSKFSNTLLQIISHWILSDEDFKRMGVNSFLLDAYFDVWVNQTYRTKIEGKPVDMLPFSNHQFLQLWLEDGQTISREMARLRFEQDKVADDLLDDFMDRIRSLDEEIGRRKDELLSNWEDIFCGWHDQTLANTVGLILAESVAEFAGVQTNSIGYSFECGETIRINVFDNEAEGNGSCQLANTYFHMPISIQDIAQHMGDSNLPSQSLVDVIERNSSLCDEHLIHSCAIANMRPEGLKLEDLVEITELNERYGPVWTNLQISNPMEAVLHRRRRFALTDAIPGEDMTMEQRAEMLDFEVSLDVCSDFCHSCGGNGMMNLYPIHLAKYTTNRNLFDQALGQWNNHPGYRKSREERQTINNESGDKVPSETLWSISHAYQEIMMLRDAVKYPSPYLGYAIARHQEIPQYIEHNVRTMDVI